MSYIKKIEKDYNDSLISLSNLSQLRKKYLALSEEEKKELDYNSLLEPAEGIKNPSKTLDDDPIYDYHRDEEGLGMVIFRFMCLCVGVLVFIALLIEWILGIEIIPS
jgi:hypothetical protein